MGPALIAPVKREFDLAAALIGLVVTSPMLHLGAAAVRLTSPGPVFYRARRAGRGGRRDAGRHRVEDDRRRHRVVERDLVQLGDLRRLRLEVAHHRRTLGLGEGEAGDLLGARDRGRGDLRPGVDAGVPQARRRSRPPRCRRRAARGRMKV